jgi:DNA polymerase-3 subunit delta'
VIVAADRLRIEAANAFLKTLEEPPPKSVFILITVEPQRILETILSRCLRLSFSGDDRVASNPKVVSWIEDFASQAAQEQKSLISRYRLLGKLLQQFTLLKAEIEKTLSAQSPLQRYQDAEVDADLRDKWETELSAAVEAEYRRQRLEWLVALEWWLRDILLHTLSMTGEAIRFPQLSNATKSIAGRVNTDDAMKNIEIIERTQRILHTNVQEALVLEVGLLQLKL